MATATEKSAAVQHIRLEDDRTDKSWVVFPMVLGVIAINIIWAVLFYQALDTITNRMERPGYGPTHWCTATTNGTVCN